MRSGCLVLLLLLCSPAVAGPARIAPQLQQKLHATGAGEPVPVIIKFGGDANLRPFKALANRERRTRVLNELRGMAEKSQKKVRTLLQGEGKRFQPLWIINAMAMEATPELISTLAARPEIEWIEEDGVFAVPEVRPAQTEGVEWNIGAVGAPALWAQGHAGQGVTVAILDSGVDVGHPDLGPRWRGGANSWFDPYRQTIFPYDVDGHGTWVGGVIVGGETGGTAIGVAPEAEWIAAKIFDDAGFALNSRVILSLQWLLDPNGDRDGADAPDLVNISWGFEAPDACLSGDSEAGGGSIRQAVQALEASGIGVIAAAGNAGSGGAPSSVSPGNYPETLAVGAVDESFQLAPFSSSGPSACDGGIYPELAAPGVQIRTSDLTPPGFPPQFAVVDGTSFAAPHVTGVIALLLSAFPDLPVSELREGIQLSATDLGTSGPDQDYGFGLVNAQAAYDYHAFPDPAAVLKEPNGGELLTAGTAFIIRWRGVSGAAGYRLQYSIDNGVTWSWIKKVEAVTSYPWTVPEVAAGTYGIVRVIALDAAGKPMLRDVSDAPFLIIPNPLRVISPNGGETFVSGTIQIIRWDTLPGAASYRLHYSLDDGETWRPIGTVGPFTELAWKVPVVLEAQAACRLRVTAFDENGKVLRRDRSDLPFTLSPNPLRVISPNGGETLVSGTLQAIRWGALTGAASYRLNYSLDNGESWRSIGTVSALTEWAWKVPVVLEAQAACRLRVTAFDEAGKFLRGDRSDAPFTIAPSPFRVLSPQGGEMLTSKTVLSIDWTAAPGAATYRLKYSLDGGTTWNLIGKVGEVTGFSWTIPPVLELRSACLVRVTALSAAEIPLITDTSDFPFTIRP